MRFLIFLSAVILVSCSQWKYKPQGVKPVNRDFKVSWIKNHDPVYQTGNLPIGWSSPKIDGERVYVGDLSGYMTAYDIETGRTLWKTNDEAPLGGKPKIVGDMLIYGSMMGRVFARNKNDGRLLYAVDVKSPIESEGMIYKGRLFFHLRNHIIVALDMKTGKILWSYKRAVPFLTTLHRVSTPIGYGDAIIVGFADGYLVSLGLQDGILKWETKLNQGSKFVDVDLKPHMIEKYVWTASSDSVLKLVNPKNGLIEKIIDFEMSTAPLVVGDKVYLGSRSGELGEFSTEGKLIKRVAISQEGISSLVSWKSKLVLADYSGMLYAVSAGQNYEISDRFDFGSHISSIFGFLDHSAEHLAAFSSRNRLYIFR